MQIKSTLFLSLLVFLFFTSIIFGVSQVSAEISGRYLTADLAAADLSGIVSIYPTLFWTALIIFIILCVGYCVYHFLRKKKTESI